MLLHFPFVLKGVRALKSGKAQPKAARNSPRIKRPLRASPAFEVEAVLKEEPKPSSCSPCDALFTFLNASRIKIEDYEPDIK